MSWPRGLGSGFDSFFGPVVLAGLCLMLWSLIHPILEVSEEDLFTEDRGMGR